MRWFNVGFCLVLAILVSIVMYCMNYGYYPAPQAPKLPKYPQASFTDQSYTPSQTGIVGSTINAFQQSQLAQKPVINPSTPPAQISTVIPSQNQIDYGDYQAKMNQYRKEMDQYEKANKNYMKDKYLPYLKNMINRSFVAIVIVEVVAILIMRFISVTVGGAYAFGGLLGFFGWVFGGLMTIPFYFASLMSSQTDSPIKVEEYLLSIGWSALFAVIVLTVIGVILVENRIRLNLKFLRYTPPPPPPLPQ